MILLFLFVVLPLATLGVVAPRLSVSEHADTEVSAYAALQLPARNARGLDVSLVFNGTATNNVEIALGRDADGDGCLTLHETGIVIGWDCGRYFVESLASGERYEESAAVGCPDRQLCWHCSVKRGCLQGVTVSNETGSVFASFATNAPAWLYDADWNLMRLTARGVDVPDERFTVTPLETGLLVNLR